MGGFKVFESKNKQSGKRNVLVPMTGADGFVRALNSMMRRSGQGELIGQTVLELASAPQEEHLRKAVASLVARHPLLYARQGRAGFFTPAWRVVTRHSEDIPLAFWREGTPDCPSLPDLQDRLLNSPVCESGSYWNVRFDLFIRKDRSAVFLFTWAHLLIDGKGAEMMLQEISLWPVLPSPPLLLPAESKSLAKPREVFAHLKKMAQHFTEIAKIGFRSFSGPGARSGRLRFHLLQFDDAVSQRITKRASDLTGPLFNLPFYLSCACRAAHVLLALSDEPPKQYVVSVPAHLRKKGGQPDLFHNKLTMLFFRMMPESLASLKDACRSAFDQFQMMSKAGLDKSFQVSLNTLKFVPAGAYIRFVLLHGRGEIVSFFHSFTGEFHNSSAPFLGQNIVNAYHIPSISTPPGVGLFFGQHRGRLNVTITWREGVLSRSDVAALGTSLVKDLTGEASIST